MREAAKREPGVHAPTSQMRALRELEPPTGDEGFVSVERVPFVRERSEAAGVGAGVFVAAPVLRAPGWEKAIEQGDPTAPHLLYDWSPDGEPDALAALTAALAGRVSGPVESAVCPHPARAAGLLVQAAASRAPARLRPHVWRRPRALDADRLCALPPDARDGARRPVL